MRDVNILPKSLHQHGTCKNTTQLMYPLAVNKFQCIEIVLALPIHNMYKENSAYYLEFMTT